MLNILIFVLEIKQEDKVLEICEQLLQESSLGLNT
jgi:hypothetical protein